MKPYLFQSCGHCWVFQICWHIECNTFTASSFRIWNSSTGIPLPPIALFIVMLPKAHLTLHFRLSCSRLVITPDAKNQKFHFMIMVPQFHERVAKTILWVQAGLLSDIPSPNTTLVRRGIVWKLSHCSLCNLFLLCSQITLEKNGYWKWLFCDWIHSVGINKAARSPTPSILPVPRNLYGHCAGKFGIDNPNCTEFTPTHPCTFSCLTCLS